MEIRFRESFEKDLDEISDQLVFNEILKVIEIVGKTGRPQDIPNLKKLKGAKNAFRIKLGRFRIGLYIVGPIVEFTRVLPRNRIYHYFPL